MGVHNVPAERVSKSDLGSSELFDAVPDDVLTECAARAEAVHFPRGTALIRQGELPEYFYILVDGIAEVVVQRKGEAEEFVDVLHRGDCVGDLALLLGQPRTATVRALRDCRAVRILSEDFAWLTRAAPDFTLQLARVLGRRLQRTTHRHTKARPVDSVAVVVLSDTIDGNRLRGELGASLARVRPVGVPSLGLLDARSAPMASMLPALHDADAILVAVNGDATVPKPKHREALQTLLDLVADLRPRPDLHLLLVHQKEPPYRGTLPWLRDPRIRAWHHVLGGEGGSLDRLARRLVGAAVGLVLSGGGARGFAHIGVLKAFAEAGIPVDAIGGSSMGAIVGAFHAFGLTTDEIVANVRRNFVERGGVPDYTIPYVALRTGFATDSYLKRVFGDARVEDLRIPFFCVASNLSTAETVIHQTGRLWRAVRSSISVPGILPPIRSRGGLLVDGGLLDNLPVREMRARCAGRIVASDVSVAVDPMRPSQKSRRRRFRPFARARMPGLGSILMRTVQLASVRDSRVAGVPADLYLNASLNDIGMSDFDRLEEIVERGAAHARKQLAGWKG